MRCKACDNALKDHEIFMCASTLEFEDLCRKCRVVILGFEEDNDEAVEYLSEHLFYEGEGDDA